MSRLPEWVIETVAARTGIDVREASRKARATVCPTCSAHVIVGLDADMCAFTARADPTPLSRIGEVLALAAHRATYTYTGKPPRLDSRDKYAITRASAAEVIVLPEHVCGAPALPTRPVQARAATVRMDAGAPPPY